MHWLVGYYVENLGLIVQHQHIQQYFKVSYMYMVTSTDILLGGVRSDAHTLYTTSTRLADWIVTSRDGSYVFAYYYS